MIRTVASKATRRTSIATAAAASGLRQVGGGGPSTSAGGCHRRGAAWLLPRHRDTTATAVRSASSLMSAGGSSLADRRTEKNSGAAMASSACSSVVLLPTCPRRSLVSLTSLAVRSPNQKQRLLLTPRRSMGMYRRPHQRNLREDPSAGADVDFDDANPALSADDMETYDFLSGGADFHPLEDDDDAFGKSHSEGDDGDGGAEDDAEDDEERIRQDLEEERKAQAIRDELDRRTGRGWTDDWTITDEDWFAGRKLDDLPDWSPEICSRMSLERVKVVEGNVPTLSTLSSLALPPSQTPHPASGNPKPYTKHARRSIWTEIQEAVEATAADRVTKIMNLSTWEEKQDAIDELFESVEEELRSSDEGRMSVLSAQPKFCDWVEAALERYLKKMSAKAGEGGGVDASTDGDEGEDAISNTDSESSSDSPPTTTLDANATPMFMDVLESGEDGSEGSPSLVSPLKSHHKDGPGRMVEEWDLAANKATKRIMVRQCVRDIAQTLEEAGKEGSDNVVRRVFVKGKTGVGKTAALAAIVASARKSGQIVLYLPDGDRFRKLGKYIRPNNHREGDLYDLPVLAMEVCDHFLESHGDDLEGMAIDAQQAAQYLTVDELHRIFPQEGDGEADVAANSISLVDLLKAGSESTSLSSGCYAAVVDALMNQTEKTFVAVVDGFNCYFDHGHYFHEAYDPDVNKAIPFQKTTLLKPLLEAMGVEKTETRKGLCRAVESKPMKRGAIVVGTTESHSVARKFTDTLSEAMEAQQGDENGVKVVEVCPFSPIEVEHIVANFEITGVGRLRFDRGATVMNDQEVAYLRLVSGGNGQNLMDACII